MIDALQVASTLYNDCFGRYQVNEVVNLQQVLFFFFVLYFLSEVNNIEISYVFLHGFLFLKIHKNYVSIIVK